MADEPKDEVAGSEKTLEEYRRELEACLREKDEYLKGWQRAKADFLNAERDWRKLEGSLAKSREKRMLKELLEFVDSFENAFMLSPPDTPWTQGIRQVHDKLLSYLASYEVIPIDIHIKKFNPYFHEAIELEETDMEEHDDTIAGVLQKGYMIRDEVLRPAKVKVAKYKGTNNE